MSYDPPFEYWLNGLIHLEDVTWHNSEVAHLGIKAISKFNTAENSDITINVYDALCLQFIALISYLFLW